MSEPIAVNVESLYKRYRRGRRTATLFRLLKRAVRSEGRQERGWTLEAIDLEVPRGSLTALIGENGAGKTTLLKTVSGLYRPTRGRVSLRGEAALVAGLGAGMVEELSVRDNVWLYAAVCRIRRSTIRRQYDEILEWADLAGFDEAELRTLSTGMRTRLAFSVSRYIDAAVVLVDEAFSSGDRGFQQKCDAFFASRLGGEQTFLIATHNLPFVESFCDRTIWLHSGRIEAQGPTPPILERYEVSG